MAKLSKHDRDRIARMFPRNTGGMLLEKHMVHQTAKDRERRDRNGWKREAYDELNCTGE